MGFRGLALEELVITLVFAICHLLSLKGKSVISTYLGIIAILYICLRVIAVFGLRYNVQVFFLVLIPMIIASESVKIRRKTLLSVLLLIIYFTSRYLAGKYPPRNTLPPPWNTVLPEVNLLMAIGVVSYSFLRYRRAFQRSELSLQDANSSIVKMANIDMLTQVYNRMAIERSLQLCITDVQKGNSDYIAGLIDIDNFKNINDSYGHLRGDEVLQEMCRRMRGSLRSQDFFGRWGGEEFLVILKERDLLRGTATMDRLRNIVDESTFQGSDGSDIKVSITVGVAQIYSGSTVESVYNEADKYLYTGKKSGKNRVVSRIS